MSGLQDGFSCRPLTDREGERSGERGDIKKACPGIFFSF